MRGKVKTGKTSVCFLLVLGLLALVLAVPGAVHKRGAVAPDDTIISSEAKNSDLYKEIQGICEEYRIEPIDATVDRVWKAIPGYNGLEIDIDASYMEMRAGGKLDKNRIIFKEIPPGIHLADLGPQPIYRGNPEKPMAAFLINVAWGNEYLPGMLKTLDDHQIKTTFFFDGSWVKKNPDLAVKIHESGHEIGNHAYSHPDLQLHSKARTVEELSKTNDIIEKTLGVKPTWFAPPSGSFNEITVQTAHELGMKTVLWTVDTVDWQKPETREMVNRVVSKVENGSMILMHPTKPSSEGLDAMITNIKGKGYQLGTVSDLMDEKRCSQ